MANLLSNLFTRDSGNNGAPAPAAPAASAPAPAATFSAEQRQMLDTMFAEQTAALAATFAEQTAAAIAAALANSAPAAPAANSAPETQDIIQTAPAAAAGAAVHKYTNEQLIELEKYAEKYPNSAELLTHNDDGWPIVMFKAANGTPHRLLIDCNGKARRLKKAVVDQMVERDKQRRAPSPAAEQPRGAVVQNRTNGNGEVISAASASGNGEVISGAPAPAEQWIVKDSKARRRDYNNGGGAAAAYMFSYGTQNDRISERSNGAAIYPIVREFAVNTLAKKYGGHIYIEADRGVCWLIVGTPAERSLFNFKTDLDKLCRGLTKELNSRASAAV